MSERILEVGQTDNATRNLFSDDAAMAEIKLTGEWLGKLGFKVGDRVVIRATQGRIELIAEWVDQHGLIDRNEP